MIGFNVCGICGRRIKEQYELCVGCERKWMRVYGDCLKGGMNHCDATRRANEVYPRRFVRVI
jgi:hypothetical protein